MPGQTPFPKKIGGLNHAHNRFFTLGGNDAERDLPLCDVENSVGGVSLRKEDCGLF